MLFALVVALGRCFFFDRGIRFQLARWVTEGRAWQCCTQSLFSLQIFMLSHALWVSQQAAGKPVLMPHSMYMLVYAPRGVVAWGAGGAEKRPCGAILASSPNVHVESKYTGNY